MKFNTLINKQNISTSKLTAHSWEVARPDTSTLRAIAFFSHLPKTTKLDGIKEGMPLFKLGSIREQGLLTILFPSTEDLKLLPSV